MTSNDRRRSGGLLAFDDGSDDIISKSKGFRENERSETRREILIRNCV